MATHNPHLFNSLEFLRGQSSGIKMAVELLESAQLLTGSRAAEIIALKAYLSPKEGGTNVTLGETLERAEAWEKENDDGSA